MKPFLLLLSSIFSATLLPLSFVSGQDISYQTEITQITAGPKHHFFGYIGHGVTIPWNQSGKYIVALQTDFYLRMPEKGEGAEIILIDTENNFKVEVIDTTFAWNLQQGTMLYWNPDQPESQFFFNDLDPASGVVFTVLYDIWEKRRIREYRFGNESIANGGVCPAGGFFIGINYGKLTRSRKVISYAGATDWTEEGSANPENDGIFKIDILSGKRELLVSYRRLAEFLEVNEPDYPVYAHHTTLNRDGSRIFFVVRGREKFFPNAGCIIHGDGTGLIRHEFDGHPEWAEGNLLVLPGEEAFELHDVDQQTLAGHIGESGVFPNTWEDNALSPDGKWFVGSHNPTNKQCVYTFYHMENKNFIRTDTMTTFRDGKDVRIDPAPRWNRTSDAILVPGIAVDRTRQLFIIRLKKD